MIPNNGIEQELDQQELARRRLAPFAWYTFRGYRIAAMHRAIAEKLEQVERYVVSGGREGIGRLMIFCPPRHGKSELVSVRFPAWFLGRNPDFRVILACCTADLATGFSRQGRNIVIGEEFKVLFGAHSTLEDEERVEIAEDSRAANVWELAGHRGGLIAAGVGGSIVGRGAHLAILDDPFKNRSEAESQRVRDDVDAWYRSTFYTRLESSGAIVLMHQRWHSDDLAGRLLRRMVEEPGADQWEVLCLPAIADDWAQEAIPDDERVKAMKDGWYKCQDALGRKPGQALWPKAYSLEALKNIRTNIGSLDWESMYQQRPQRVTGALIKANSIIKISLDELPKDLRLVRGWDLAVSGRKRADYISGALVGRDVSGRTYIIHIDRTKGPWADARPEMKKTMLKDAPSVTQAIEEAGQQGGYFQEFQRDPELQGRPVIGVSTRAVGNKEVRAQVWASRIQDGLIYVVTGNGWDVEAFISEAIAFPRGRHDDQVDSVSLAVQALGTGSGWAVHAKREIERMRAEGVNVDEFAVERPWLHLPDTSDYLPDTSDFVLKVKRLAEGCGDLLVLPDGLDERTAGNLMAEVAAKYIDQRQAIKAQIVLSERRRLGV